MKYKDPDATKGFYQPDSIIAFENYFPRYKLADYYDNDLIVTESNNPLIKPGDILRIDCTDYLYPECPRYLRVTTNNLPKDCAWKFALVEDMQDSKEFDNLDWRQELDDIRNLGRYNFFHLDSFAKLMDSIKVEVHHE